MWNFSAIFLEIVQNLWKALFELQMVRRHEKLNITTTFRNVGHNVCTNTGVNVWCINRSMFGDSSQGDESKMKGKTTSNLRNSNDLDKTSTHSYPLRFFNVSNNCLVLSWNTSIVKSILILFMDFLWIFLGQRVDPLGILIPSLTPITDFCILRVILWVCFKYLLNSRLTVERGDGIKNQRKEFSKKHLPTLVLRAWVNSFLWKCGTFSVLIQKIHEFFPLQKIQVWLRSAGNF